MGNERAFDAFVHEHSHRLWQALVPLGGPDAAADAVAVALAWAWQHWERVAPMENPAGYLYVMARRDLLRRRPVPDLPRPDPVELPTVEPGLVDALAELSEMQRQVVYLIDGLGWGLTEVARLLDVSVSTVRNHRARGLDRLRSTLGETGDA